MAEPKRVKLMRGNESSRLSVTPAQGEQISTIDELKLYLGDGNKAGGFMVNADNTIAVWTDQTDATKKLSLAWWIAYFNGAEATVRIPRGTHEVLYDMTIPENLCLHFDKGATLKVADTKTLTFNGAIEAGLWQIFSGTGTVAGTPVIAEVYPEWFGAVGDDTTDDTLSLQKAIDFASGNTLQLSNKTYLMKRVDVSNPCTIYFNGATLHAVVDGMGLYEKFVKINATQDVVLTGPGSLRMNSLTEAYTGEWMAGLSIYKSKNITVDNIFVYDTGGEGIEICGDDGFALGSENIVIRNCTCDHARRNGFSVTNGQNILVDNCTFINTKGTNPQAGIDIEPNGDSLGKNITIRNCYFKDNEKKGLMIYKALGTDTCDIFIENCTFENEKTALGASAGGDEPHLEHCIIENCVFKNCDKSIVLYRAKNMVIKECTITSNTERGIYLQTLLNTKLINNYISTCGTEGIFASAVDDLVIQGNSVSECGHCGIAITQIYDGIVSNNWLSGNGVLGITDKKSNIDGDSIRRSIISNNIIRKGNPEVTDTGITIRKYSVNVLVVNNDCYLGGIAAGLSIVSENVATYNRNAGNINNDGTYSTTGN